MGPYLEMSSRNASFCTIIHYNNIIYIYINYIIMIIYIHIGCLLSSVQTQSVVLIGEIFSQ